MRTNPSDSTNTLVQIEKTHKSLKFQSLTHILPLTFTDIINTQRHNKKHKVQVLGCAADSIIFMRCGATDINKLKILKTQVKCNVLQRLSRDWARAAAGRGLQGKLYRHSMATTAAHQRGDMIHTNTKKHGDYSCANICLFGACQHLKG